MQKRVEDELSKTEDGLRRVKDQENRKKAAEEKVEKKGPMMELPARV